MQALAPHEILLPVRPAFIAFTFVVAGLHRMFNFFTAMV